MHPSNDPRTGSTFESRPESRRAILHSISTAAIVAGLLIGFNATAALAKSPAATPAPAAAAQDTPAIDPDAMEALNKMGAYLRTLKSFQVISDNTTDDVLDDGQVVQSSTKVDLLASMPNRLRVEITGNDKHRLYLYDGKNFTVWGELVNYYATVPAPATTGQLVDTVYDKYGIELPLTDLFKWGTDQDTIKRIQKAIDIGPASVDGITCEQYVFHQEGTDWQIWIQLGDFPLPRKLVIRTLTDDAKPQHSATLTWNLAPSFNDDSFAFVPGPDAHRIAMPETDTDNTQKGK